YLSEGTYKVTLSVKAGSGCYSDVFTKTITVYPLPVSKFISLANTCINTDYVLTDASTVTSATVNKIVKWQWDLGDNTIIEKTDNSPIIHKYTSTGTYKITLITTSSNGCISEVFSKDVIVTNLPIPDFTTPDVCLNDAFAEFVNTSKNVNGTSEGLTYQWNFGEIGSTTNTSNDKNGKHIYTVDGDYKVTLTITNENGCQISVEKAFTVNGQVKRADFSIQNENNLCSNSPVIINNLSEVATGKITKIEIYQDLDGKPEEFVTYKYPKSEDISLIYAAIGGNNNKDFRIKLKAYSGIDCFKEVIKQITLKPVPILEFSDIPSVCQNDGSVVINQARETSLIAGIGHYSGDGIDAEGNFNPKNVQPGVHTITYTFIADNGCVSVLKKDVNVYQSPTTDIGPTLYILAGGQITIPTVAEGKALTYKWSPSVGLNRDDVLNPIAFPDKDTEYELVATTSEGCKVITSVLVKVLQALVPPNSFTPNGDGVNDVWDIKYLDTYPSATIDVFNRNGGKVFSSVGYKTPFDGNYQNQPLPVGVYYYLINPRNGRKTITGPLT
ncbi:MAG: T9SS type B sorting domain-containing protein, partial [Pedobacter sp.]